MTYEEFLERVISEGIAAAKTDYAAPAQRMKLQGSVEGFEACRGQKPEGIAGLLKEAGKRTEEAKRRLHLEEISAGQYWRTRCREAEIEWVANVVSATLVANKLTPIIVPTARGCMHAARILGMPV